MPAAPWCSGLTRHPVKVEIVGSNPIGVAKQPRPARGAGKERAVKRVLRPFILVLSFIDSVVASVVRPHQLRNRTMDRMGAKGAPPPDRRPPRR